MNPSQNVKVLDHPCKAVWFIFLGMVSIAFVINALCSISTFGWILGWYLLIGHLVMAWLASQHNSFIIHGGIFFSLILQVIDFARHETYIALFFRCFSIGEGYEIARFAVIILLSACIILATVACSRGVCFNALATPYLIEIILAIMFTNAVLYKNALIANVLGIFMIICIFTKTTPKLVIAKFMIVCLFLTFPYIGSIDSSILQIENAHIEEISDYVIKFHSKCIIFLTDLAYLICLLAISVWQMRKGDATYK